MTRIPIDPNGYKVNPNTGTIHTRYADHGNGQRTRTTIEQSGRKAAERGTLIAPARELLPALMATAPCHSRWSAATRSCRPPLAPQQGGRP